MRSFQKLLRVKKVFLMTKLSSFDSEKNMGEAWYTYAGPDNDVVLSSRINLKRNLENYAFPNTFKFDDAERVQALLLDSFSKIPDADAYSAIAVKNLEALGQRILIERGIIKSSIMTEPMASLLIRSDGKLAGTINVGDHLRLTSFVSGFNIQEAFSLCKGLDDALQEHLQFSCDADFGYLTSNISDSGSGMKISVLLHLPSIHAANLFEKVFKEILANNYNISGFYGTGAGDGSSLGDYYLLSSNNSLQGSEQTQIEEFSLYLAQLIELERKLRKKLTDNEPTRLRDSIYRALATVKFARYISSNEAIDLISRIKWGTNLGILSEIQDADLLALLFRTQTAHLQYILKTSTIQYEKDVKSEEQKVERLRSLIIQEAVSKVQLIT